MAKMSGKGKELPPLPISEEPQPIPYRELARGYYWCRSERNGTWYVWQIALVDIAPPNIEVRFAFGPGAENPYIVKMDYDPPKGNGLFFYERVRLPSST